MKRVMRRSTGSGLLVVALSALGLAVVAPLACSSKAAPVGKGGPCVQAVECDVGLVCLPQTDGSRACGDDLTSVQTVEEAGAATDAAEPRDAALTDATSARDVGTDSNAPHDAEAPHDAPHDSAPKDSAPPPEDSAPPEDASSD